jgi:DNA mismatch repair ATPase MutS
MRIEQLAGLIYSFENSRANLALQPFNILLHLNLRNAMKIERWRRLAGASIPAWVDAAAEFEALVSLAVFAYENPSYNFPEFVEDGPCFTASDLGHPLLKPEIAVVNDVSLEGDLKLLLISGSNMAGKSTFLRSVGVNAVLAQAGAPIYAKKLKLSRLALGCSIQISDSLADGISHFYAEILRLKQLVDLTTDSKIPVLFFFDEILHGTNSSDRCNGASAVIRSLVKAGAAGFVTTHDLSLTTIAEELGAKAKNVHFEDQFADGKMSFDYKMKQGIVTHGNALQLMKSLGLEV